MIQILAGDDRSGTLRQIAVAHSAASVAGDVGVTLRGHAVRLTLAPDLPEPMAVTLVSVGAELESRRAPILNGDALAMKTVLLVGAGSLGSKTAVLLAEAGCGTQLVLDNDEFTAANLSRHAGGLRDLGRRKVHALAELIEERCVHAEALDCDVLALADEELDAIVHRADLVVATTDSAAAQFVVNEACVRTKTPAIFAGAYERACGGELIAVRPHETPCLLCAVGFRAGLEVPMNLRDRRQAYQDADHVTLHAEPGLGVDIAYLAAMTAAYALALLAPNGSRSILSTPEWGFALVHGGSSPRAEFADLFTTPFEVVRARVRRDEPCCVCGWSDTAVSSDR